MGDRSNIFLVYPQDEAAEKAQGIYLYSHWGGLDFSVDALSEALDFGRSRWDDATYLARFITTKVFEDLVDVVTGGGISPYRTDNEHPITVVDLAKHEVSFAPEGQETDRDSWYSTLSYPEFVAAHPVNA